MKLAYVGRNLLSRAVSELALKNEKMAFISGPRQVGKTTFAKSLLPKDNTSQYFNWDQIEFRRIWTKNPSQIVESIIESSAKKNPILAFDEIHKAKSWKRTLKGLYDVYAAKARILVTGSARLDVYKKGGDSLMGRYLNFRLHPFSVGELISKSQNDPENVLQKLFRKRSNKQDTKGIYDDLFEYSGFPEPFLKKSKKWLRIWNRGRLEKIIREDLRDLSRIPELSQIEMLCSLMPEKVSSTLSLESLREDLEVSHPTVRRWLNYLKELYYHFELKPYSNKIARSLKKDGKIYLYNWTEIDDSAARFENLVASHLLKACHYWTDVGEGGFELFYLRNKDKKEIDFLIAKDKKPWLTMEAKLSESSLDQNYRIFRKYINCPHIQIIHKPDHWKLVESDVLIASAHKVLALFP